MEGSGAQPELTFFLKFKGYVKKVTKKLKSLDDLYDALKLKFPEVNAERKAITFHTKDRKYNVEMALDSTDEVYDGALIEVKIKGSEDATSLKRQLEEMKQKLSKLEQPVRKKGDKRGREEHHPPPEHDSSKKQRVDEKKSTGSNSGEDPEATCTIRMRGLPWGYKKEDVLNFFTGLKIKSILAILDRFGRESGEAYVVFSDEKSVESAKEKHKQMIGKRYIEIYLVANKELAMARRSTRDLLGNGEENVVLRLRGLPWQCTEIMVKDFFAPLKLYAVHLTHDSSGRFKGECLVRFNDAKTAAEGKKKHRQSIGHRYIEIYPSSLAEWETQTGVGGAGAPPMVGGVPVHTFVARMRGLPYSASEKDVLDFFSGISLLRVHLPINSNGRPSGDGFVEVSTSEQLGKVLQRNKERIGHRYVEIFRSNLDELHQVMGPPQATSVSAPHYGNAAGNAAAQRFVGATFCLKMRGLPFQATEQMITDFFKRANVTPIRIHRKNNGGEAFVEFSTQPEQQSAVTLHKEHIGRRYIELFPVSYEEVAKIVGLPMDAYSDPYAQQGPFDPYAPSSSDPYGYGDYYGASYAAFDAKVAGYDPPASSRQSSYDAKGAPYGQRGGSGRHYGRW